MVKRTKRTDKAAMILGLAMGAVVILGLLSWGTWRLVSEIPVNALRVGIIVLALAIPSTGLVCYKLGRREATSTLQGLDTGVDRVMGAASKVAGLRVSTRQAMRQPAGAVINVQPVALPEMIHRDVAMDEIVEL